MNELIHKTALATLYRGDARHMAEIADESVQVIVTSPPYFNQRKYDGQPLIWDEEPGCDHQWGDEFTTGDIRFRPGQNPGVNQNKRPTSVSCPQVAFCQRCGAWRGGLGNEPTVGLYIRHLGVILAECWRVLRPDGVLFVNIGDGYANGKGSCYNPGGGTASFQKHLKEVNAFPLQRPNRSDLMAQGIRDKSLYLVPERLGLAAQDAGWTVRSRIIWQKPNAQPESVKDRPTEDHELIYMLTKGEDYYADMEAVAVPMEEEQIKRIRRPWNGQAGRDYVDGPQNHMSKYHGGEKAQQQTTRNLRTTWAISTRGIKASHYAPFPVAIPELCIKMASRPGDLVLDPFMGAGTTGVAAVRLDRRVVGYDLSLRYCHLAVNRIGFI